MSLNPTDLKRIKEAFNEWAKNAPEPDAVLIWNRTARQLNQDIQNGTEIGQRMLEIVEFGVNREGIDKAVERITRKPPTA